MEPTARQQLEALIAECGRVVVAFSGGVDSSLVLAVAVEQLGAGATAVTAVSPSLARRDREAARELARGLGAHHVLLESHEVEDPRYTRNDPQRCYFCKTNVYETLISYAREQGIATILDGTNADDLGDHRPGLRAAREQGVRSPLQECGIGKDEIRAWARERGLSNWDRPANACLSSRIPYGSEVTAAKLAQVEAAEAILAAEGFRQFRVRHHGEVARLEVDREELPAALAKSELLTARIRETGFLYVTLDLAGFRSGSMNDALRPSATT